MKCISELKQDQCTGCEACAQICPVQAIRMQPNEEGFYFPVVDKNCVLCGKCVNVCSALNVGEQDCSVQNQVCFMLETKNKALEKNSASGGFCATLAEYYLKNYNAVIFGCVMDTEFCVYHKSIEKENEIYQIQGSKYIQSRTCRTYEEAKKFLEEDRFVVYMGTPCQIAGLKKYLHRKYEKLVTVDIICHGVPSQITFQKYIQYLSTENQVPVSQYRFRTKTHYDRAGYLSTTELQNGKRIRKTSKEDIYFYLFTQGKTYRRSCYNCQYANLNREGDFTCGDCGSRSIYHNYKLYEAMSTLILNTDKSKHIWADICDLFDSMPIDLETEAKMNKQLHSCTKYPADRDCVCTSMMNDEWKLLSKNYLPDIHTSFFDTIKHRIPIKVKRLLLKVVPFKT